MNTQVLIVDDDLMVQKCIANFCKKMTNIDLTVAGNGEDAIKNATEKQFDIIFMDLFMPGMNGYNATSAIRKLDNGKGPIIALSGDDLTEEDLIKAGFTNFVKKPITKVKFQDLVKGVQK